MLEKGLVLFFNYNIKHMNKENKWVIAILLLLITTGFLIGWLIKGDCSKPYKQVRNYLEAINSPLFIKEYSMGAIMFDLEEEEERGTQIDIMVDRIIDCESQNQMIWGDHNLPIKTYGVAQFQERTFNWLKELANAPRLNYYKEADQVYLLKWALENNYGYLWSCYKKLGYVK